MLEILITVAICLFAGFVIFKSIRNSSKGKCSCDSCTHCPKDCTNYKNKLNGNIKE